MAQITSIVSEALQAKVRSLLPSQSGFTEDLQAQNVIVPIIDLTETASGSVLRQDLQTACNLGGSIAFTVTNTTTTVVNTTGFYLLYYTSVITIGSNNNRNNTISVTDGITTKILVNHTIDSGNAGRDTTTQGNLVIFLNAGEQIDVFTSSADAVIGGTVRQIADISGNLINPVGFTGE